MGQSRRGEVFNLGQVASAEVYPLGATHGNVRFHLTTGSSYDVIVGANDTVAQAVIDRIFHPIDPSDYA